VGKKESNLSLLALYLVFFLLPFFFFPVGLLDTIATSNLVYSAISIYIISYALVILAHHPKTVPNLVINSNLNPFGFGDGRGLNSFEFKPIRNRRLLQYIGLKATSI
jgi:hypothetical protein